MGAYVGQVSPMPASLNIVKNVTSVYRVPALEVATKCVFTNTSPVSAYRGAGRPEGNYYIERLVDTAAREMGIDRVELRRRNHIPAEAIPYDTCSGLTYDSGDFPALLEHAVKFADWVGFAARRAERRAAGRRRRLGPGGAPGVKGPPTKGVG